MCGHSETDVWLAFISVFPLCVLLFLSHPWVQRLLEVWDFTDEPQMLFF